MCVGSLAGITYLRYAVLTSSNQSETAVHCCDPALSLLVMLGSRNVFQVVSALQSIVSISLYNATTAIRLYYLQIVWTLDYNKIGRCSRGLYATYSLNYTMFFKI